MDTPTKQPNTNDMTPTETPAGTPVKTNPTPVKEEGQEQMNGGRKKSRKVNPALKSWVKFVKKIQHEEKLTYPEAMKRASKRKSEWQRGGADITEESDGFGVPQEVEGVENAKMGGRRRRSRKQRGGEGDTIVEEDKLVKDEEDMMGGRRRRSRRSRSRKQRGGNVADFDNDWKQYGKVGGRRRTRRHRR